MRLYSLLHITALILSAPWVFAILRNDDPDAPLIWPIYAIVFAAGYACFVAFSLKTHWQEENTEDDDAS